MWIAGRERLGMWRHACQRLGVDQRRVAVALVLHAGLRLGTRALLVLALGALDLNQRRTFGGLERSAVRLGGAGDTLGLAEGVETTGQLQVLQSLSCNEVQGYLISRPVAAVEVPGLLHKRFLFPSLPGNRMVEAEQLKLRDAAR